MNKKIIFLALMAFSALLTTPESPAQSWTNLGSGISGTNDWVSALACDTNGNLYAGGAFTNAGGVSANCIAKWNGASWTNLGSGLNSIVLALACDPDGQLYAGGIFTTAGGVTANQIAKWNGSSWTNLGSGLNQFGPIYALACDTNGNLYAGGEFTNAGGVTANQIAKWDGSSWTNLGSGMNSSVRALACDPNEQIYAGGFFTNAGGVTANHIAKWDGISWTNLGSGMNTSVYALACDPSGQIYAAGIFTNAGGVTANNIAKWDGSSWTNLGSGMNSSVRALACDTNGQLYAGGWFPSAGGVTANRIAKWNGASWTNLGSGMNSFVSALACDPNGQLYAGGNFTNAGGVSANRIAKWGTPVNPPVLAVSPLAFTNAITQGQNCPSNTFDVWNSGGGTLNYTLTTNAGWLSVAPVSGTSTGEHDTILITYQTAALAAGGYTGQVTVVSAVATSTVSVYLTVTGQVPSITAHPQSLTNNPGSSATFSVQANGTAPLIYQWQKDATNISGATATNYTIATVAETNEGSYRCIVTNMAGSVTSSVASLTVNDLPAVPAGLSASDGTYTNKVALVWNTAVGAIGYQVWRHTVNNSSGASSIGTATSAAYDDTGAVAGTIYYYWVKATNAAGASGFSTFDSGWRRAVFTITATAGANGSITPSGAVPVIQGANQSFTILPSAGYYISSVQVDGVNVAAVSIYTFENVSANHSLAATFVANRPPQLVLTVTPQSGVAPLRVLFNFTGSTDPDGAIVKYEVDRTGDGIFEVQSTESGVFYVEFAAAGTYQAVARVTDDCNATSTETVTIQVHGVSPTAVIEAQPASGTAPLTVNFTGTNSTAPVGRQLVAYEWDFEGDGAYDRLTRTANAIWTYRVAGTYRATLRITDDAGMKAENSVLVVVLPSPFPPPVVTLSANPEAGYLPLTVSFIAQLANGQISTNYEWDFDGDGQYDTRTAIAVCSNTYTVAGMYAARVLAMDAHGLTGLGVVTVQVNQATTLRAWISTPKDNSRVRGTEVSLRAHAAPANLAASAQFQYKLAVSNDWINLGSIIYPPPSAYAMTWDVSVLPQTDYHVRVAVTDTDGAVVYSDTIRVTVVASAHLAASFQWQPGDIEEGSEDGKHYKIETFSRDSSATLIVYDGTMALVGMGTVDSNITLNVVLTGQNTNPVNGAAFGRTCIQANRQVSIEGNPELQKTVVIIIPYQDDDNNGMVDGTRVKVSTLMMFWYDTATGTWKRCLESEVHPDEKYVKGRTYRLAEFDLFGGVRESPIYGDFDGDRKSDLAIYQTATGIWRVLLSGSGYQEIQLTLGGTGFRAVPADYDADQKTDPAVYHKKDGYWFGYLSRYAYSHGETSLGGLGFLFVPSDYDGDGKADPAVYHETTGVWAVQMSDRSYQTVMTQFGGPGYSAIPGDYDGDDKTDLAVYYEGSGLWQVMASGSRYALVTMGFGGLGWSPAPADYDGDGRTDPAIYNASSGQWTILMSNSGYRQTSFALGGPGYYPAPGDYDGAGRISPAVYHETTGEWQVFLSGSDYAPATTTFGGQDFMPANVCR